VSAIQRAPDIDNLLVLRASLAQRSYRLAAGYSELESTSTAQRYCQALALDPRGLLDGDLVDVLRRIHAMVTGMHNEPLRSKSASVRAKRSDAVSHSIRFPARHIERALRELDRTIYSNVRMDPTSRAALVYYEVLKIHPFQDGNGRLARLLFNMMLRRSLGTPLVDLSIAIRTGMATYNDLLQRRERSGIYAAWMKFMLGLLLAEAHCARRISDAVGQLTLHDRRMLFAAVSGSLYTLVHGDVDGFAAHLSSSLDARAHQLPRSAALVFRTVM
jgi:hypothetical protein